MTMKQLERNIDTLLKIDEPEKEGYVKSQQN